MQTARAAARVALLVAAFASCYRMTPVESGATLQGLEVRLALSDEGSVRLAPLIGPRIGAIDGRIIESPDTAYVMAVQAVVQQTGRSMAWSNERLSVPRGAVSSVHTRTLDRKKTWIVAGLSVIGAFALGDAFGLGSGFGGFLNGGGGGKK